MRLRDSTNKVEDLIKYAIDLGHEYIAITDHEALSSFVKLEKILKTIQKEPEYKNKSIKIIRGNEIYLVRNGLNSQNYDKDRDGYFHFILLAKDMEGYHQLCELSTRAWNRSYISRRMRRVPTYYSDIREIIGKNPGHITASSACLGSMLGKCLLRYRKSGNEQDYEMAKSWALSMREIFGEKDFYLEMQPSAGDEQIFVNKQILRLNQETKIPYILTTDSHYLNKEEAPIHEAFLNSQDGDREVRSFYATTYMMNTKEIENYLTYLTRDQLDEAYSNIHKIAKDIKEFSILRPLRIPELKWLKEQYLGPLDKYVEAMPSLKKFINSPHRADRKLVDALILGILKKPDLQNQAAYDAIERCLDMTWESSEVNKARWSAYYLNLQNIIESCWRAGSIVLPARGSGGGFILLYALDIIQINPLREKTKLYDWRFLNPSRVSVLDIDFDIGGLKRAQVLQYFKNEYGEDRVSNVATFGTEKPKSAIITACRGLGLTVEEGQFLSSLLVVERGIPHTLTQSYYGDEDAGLLPNKAFITEINKYPEVWNVAKKIEGLINRLGQHAGGMVFVDEPFTAHGALMRAPDGTIVTQFELHDLEDLSYIKYDVLSVEAADKIQICLELLVEYGYIKAEPTLKETYEKTVGVYNLERNNPRMWEMVWNQEIFSLFQMEQQSGIQGIALTKPSTVDELASLNSVIRLMPESKGAETPLEKFARYKMRPELWERDMINAGLTKNERELLHKELDISFGLSIAQEQFMMLVQLPEVGGFDLQWADRLRKSIAKKQAKDYDELEKEFFERADEKKLSKNLVKYVWNAIALSKGYGFNASHTLSYSIIALQEMNLAFKYPIVFWNTANLIVDSAGIIYDSEENFENASISADLINEEAQDVVEENEEDQEDDEELEEWEKENTITTGVSDKKKVKTKSVNYGKIASAIGKFQAHGVKVYPPDINKSSFTFTPEVETGNIYYGLRGITRVPTSLVHEIMNKRPYSNFTDFIERVKVNKLQAVNLIKSGAFDALHERVDLMRLYLTIVSEPKKKLTLQNMAGLIKYNLIPEEMTFCKRLFLFNKFLKTQKSGENYLLNDAAIRFIDANFGLDITNSAQSINQKIWNKIYTKQMDPMRAYLKENQPEMLNALNEKLFNEQWEKYADGTLSHWEMESVSFYSSGHELASMNPQRYYFSDFFNIPEEPEVEREFYTKDGKLIKMFKLHLIAGTVLDRDKLKKTVTLLTETGVVTVKIYGAQYSAYDKQLSYRDGEGKKHVIEKSWFSRGNLLILQGIRRGDQFLLKKYKNSPYPVVSKINNITENGILELQYERSDVPA